MYDRLLLLSLAVASSQKEKTHADLQQALRNSQSKIADMTKSLEVWKSRSKALDVEITVLRVRIQKLLAKSKDDEQLINKLKVKSCFWSICVQIAWISFVSYTGRVERKE